MKAIAAVADILKREGVEFLSCFPGNPLIEAATQVGIRPILARSERVVVNIADGYARVSNGRRTGVCAVQFPAGIQNAYAGIVQAFADSVPILVITGQAARHRLGVLPTGFDTLRNYREVTKWVGQINSADRAPELMKRAFTYLRMGRPGPIILEIPEDVAKEELDDTSFRYSPVKAAKTAADHRDVEETVEVLLSAKSPIIHAGQGVLYAGASDELREFAELIQAPVMTTMAGKSAFPEDHPLSIGIGAESGTRAVDYFLRKADLIFGVGCGFTKWFLAAPIPEGKVIIQSGVDERDINKDYAVDQAIIGDAKLVLSQLIDEVKRQVGSEGRRGDDTVAREIKAIKEAWLNEWMPRLTSDEIPINPYRVVWDLQHAVDRAQTIVTHDAGYPRDHLAPFYEAIMPRGYIGWGHTTQLGSSLGLAMGAKLAAPEKTVINVMGDGAFGMVGMDFETAVREKIAILTIVLNNSALAGYERQMPFAAERYGIKFLSGEYAKVAAALGGYSERVEKPADIIPAIQRAKKVTGSGQPALLEIITKEELALPKYW